MGGKKSVQIVEVGPRDGLQNETKVLDVSTRLAWAEKLADAGVRRVELGAFVSPTWVPQMEGSGKLLSRVRDRQKQNTQLSKVKFSALVPNERGIEDAIKAGVREVAVFTAVSESFSKRNINCSVDESFRRFRRVFEIAQKKKIKVRGYLSTCFGCPYEGKVQQSRVVRRFRQLLDEGAYEISLGDTIGVADPKAVSQLLEKVLKYVEPSRVAMHFHDTRGMALANILRSLDYDIRIFDSSLGGIGGCPYAPGASGNVATEDVVYMLESMGYKTGIDLSQLLRINQWLTQRIQHPLPSRVGQAGLPEL